MVSGNPEDDANICANPKPVKTSEVCSAATLRHLFFQHLLVQFFKGKKTVIFAVPGAFTPLCHIQHVPSFLKNAAKIKAKGIDQIACLSVNDVFVMDGV